MMVARIGRLKACLNGGPRCEEHPAVLITPAELAREAAGAVAAGAEAVHLCIPMASTGLSRWRPGEVATAVAALRRACPATPARVSTGLWITGGNVAVRQEAVAGMGGAAAAGPIRFGVGEPVRVGTVGLLEALAAADVAAEAGMWSAAGLCPA